MTVDDLRTQLGSLQTYLAHQRRVEEYLLAAFEQQVLSCITRARSAGVTDEQIASVAAPILQDFISIADDLGHPLSSETEDLVRDCASAGHAFRESRPRRPSRPLAAAPKGPVEFSVFVDESGTPSFDESAQPVLCLAGIIVRDDAIPDFGSAAECLLEKHGLPRALEFHASEFLTATPKAPLDSLSVGERYTLLRDFVALGMSHAARVHHLSMLKSEVKPEYRRKMLAQGLDAYSHTVVWFVVTLDRACLLATMAARYKYFYDRTDAYRKDIGRIFRALETTPNKRLRLFGLKGPPVMLESHKSRGVQLADVVGYYLNRYRQFEFPAIKRRGELTKHEDKIREIYSLVKPKIADYLGKDLPLTVDWKALADFSLKPSSKFRPPAGRRRR